MSKQIKINRKLFDKANKDSSKYIAKPGLTRELVIEISKQKKEPKWMLDKRLEAYQLYIKAPMPNWGPDLSKLNLDEIVYFVRPDTEEKTTWEEVPEEIKKTFDRLGIPEAEKKSLAGVGAQYDSDIVYHNLQTNLKKQGVIFENMDVAVQKYPELVKKHFMTNCVPITDHKFASLHAAVWSGGTFIYIPKGIKVELPLQAYFRMNAEAGGQFEHTMIIVDEGADVAYIEGCSAPRYSKNSLHAGCVEIFVGKNAKMKYFSIENWSKNTYNLNTKRALVEKNATMEWVSGNLGSGVTMLYPCSILRGEGAKSDNLGIAYSGEGQDQDIGAKTIHVAPNTSSITKSRSISAYGGRSTFRGLVKISKNAKNSKAIVICDGLLMDEKSSCNTIPSMDIYNNEVEAAHEARVGKIGDEEIFYLMSKGISEERAIQLIVAGFIEPIVKVLPFEYALELNRLIEMEMEGSII
ncbi:MAG: Fe-S cluster assembly protein SufB [Candidatus Magasanikbacteria bacterium RIFCSPHIGHO2_01_FULL_33_34]|uniref:Fe-S cluster assembly protein SufB n=1 Tax=Candidatus Magasanikbacteria bacterium RIFCSPHIGHO2_01_FULL_33_34 TaxID=1798671 RepID=A0A1F6LHN4_9BACT|nr:MAG: Fe-S cluster assembly protein SufB [Candidatus Magasanikbacteria bacterium RIFCSPHIGHO2_01_FULL_33_34]OGH65195.1 MAG: Fe-S cluster assembly protein SufB [Candidatus Magasanikbacteria bacterium RIFCSPHIGHO2_02_FULL_33_17]OGH75260.1 MAG: Fe-S cluster assembly protein SufB [Candidatus Magasanikbacteria bacterium RIFCSPLOWO2_01_FULL_33_34]OGH82182.1 MAG: Fe-S cluster assembly protein SufB [Candidatus Magasanikbacteria bacterium RIFCSPLOWO2_12_FULL_34_7]